MIFFFFHCVDYLLGNHASRYIALNCMTIKLQFVLASFTFDKTDLSGDTMITLAFGFHCNKDSFLQLKNEKTNLMSLAILFHFLCAQRVSTLIYPSSGAWDCVVELPHQSSCSQFIVYWRFGAAGFEWCSFCRFQPENKTTDVVIQQYSRKLLMMDILMSEIQPAKRAPLKTSRTKSPTHNELRTRWPML